MSCRLISSDEGKQDNGAGFASPSYLIRVRAWAFYLDAILVSLIVSASRVVGRLASCRRDVSCVSSDEGQASKEAGRVIILGPVSSASAPSSVRPGVPSPGSRAVITSSPHPQQASRQAEAWRPRRSYPCGHRQTRTSKQDENDGRPRPHPHHHTEPRSPHPMPHRINRPAPDKQATRRRNETQKNNERRRADETKNRDDKNDGRTTGRTTERKHTSPVRRQASK